MILTWAHKRSLISPLVHTHSRYTGYCVSVWVSEREIECLCGCVCQCERACTLVFARTHLRSYYFSLQKNRRETQPPPEQITFQAFEEFVVHYYPRWCEMRWDPKWPQFLLKHVSLLSLPSLLCILDGSHFRLEQDFYHRTWFEMLPRPEKPFAFSLLDNIPSRSNCYSMPKSVCSRQQE